MYQILDDFKSLLLTVDANISHYFGLSDGEPWQPYTVWTEYELDGLHGGDTYAEPVWRVLIERYTKTENDDVVLAMMAKLETAPGVTFQYSLRRNQELGMLYHAWDCEVSSGTL